jgi:VanZ family protein
VVSRVNDVHKLVSETTWYGNERVEGIQVVAYQPAMTQRVFTIAGWLAFAFIVYATLSPIDARPVLAGPQLEHFAAFALMGFAFALAYPDRVLLVAAMVLISAFGLEALQLLTPDRHGRLLDALVKAAGGICGIGIGQLAQLVLRSRINRTS